jgi:hypothetical protein
MIKVLSESEIKEMKAMRLASVSSRHIGIKFGVSRTIVDKHTKNEYLKIKAAGEKTKKRPLVFRWETTEAKIYFLLKELHSNHYGNGSVHELIANNKLCKRYYKALVELGIIVKQKGVTVWARETPTKIMANEVWVRCYHNRKQEQFKGYHPYFRANSKPKNNLTLAELKQLWQMHEEDCNLNTICLYMRIKQEYALECIEAAKWLYGGGLAKLQKQNAQYAQFKMPPRKPGRPKVVKLADPEPFVRLKGEYSNTTAYGGYKYGKTING